MMDRQREQYLRKKAMDARDREIVNKLKSLLHKRVKLHQVILFGSRARGDSDPDSDMDVLVVLDEPRTHKVNDIVFSIALGRPGSTQA
jgi:predicted nucleotidyltransferase